MVFDLIFLSCCIEFTAVKKLLSVLCSALLFTGLSAQVKNGGFESCSAYPTQLGQVSLLSGWTNAGSSTSTPDFYHYAGGLAGDIPVTPVGEVDAFLGSGVAGFAATGLPHTHYREYLCNQLTAPLVTGDEYRLTFQVSNGYWTAGSLSGLGTSDLGVHFSVAPPTQLDNDPLMVVPHAKLDTVVYSRFWVEITFDFVADQAHKYMVLGVFGSDSGKSITAEEGDDPQLAYYFVDDVSIISLSSPEQNLTDGGSQRADDASNTTPDDSVEAEQFYIPNAFTPNHDGENDVFLPVLPAHTTYNLQIYSRWGEVVFETANPAQGWTGQDAAGSDVQPGIYVWSISYLEKVGDELEAREHQGTLTLMR